MFQDISENYFRFSELNKNNLHPIILAAEMHERLFSIHSFIDGNGRTYRLIMNLILLQHGFPLAIIDGDYESPMTYYDALEKVQTEEDKLYFILLIAQKVLTGLEWYINILSPR